MSLLQQGTGLRSVTDVLIVIETSAGEARPAALELLSASRELAAGGMVCAVVVGHEVAAVAEQVARRGADQVWIADHSALARYTTDTYATAIEAAIAAVAPSLVLLPGTTSGRDLGPYLAARAGTTCLSDCISLRWEADGLVATRPVYGGKMLSDARLSQQDGAPAFGVLRAGTYPVPDAIEDMTAPV